LTKLKTDNFTCLTIELPECFARQPGRGQVAIYETAIAMTMECRKYMQKVFEKTGWSRGNLLGKNCRFLIWISYMTPAVFVSQVTAKL